MAYSDDAVRAKLTSLNETQDSIVTNAQWILFHRRHADKTAALWLDRLKESQSANKRLNLIYLANEVVQQSRARGKQDFMRAFQPLIAGATTLAYKGTSQDIQGKLRRVVQVWRERAIFPPEVLNDVDKSLDEVDKSKGASKLGGGGARLGGSLFGGGGSGVATELSAINKDQLSLTKAETASKAPVLAANAEYVKMMDPSMPVPSAPVRAAKLRGLVKDLMAARHAVETTIAARRDLVAGLEKLIEANRTKIGEEESTASDLANKIDGIEATINSVEDSIMRGTDMPPANGHSNGEYSSRPEPERPETEGFTPPPPEIESFTPPLVPQAPEDNIGEHAPLEAPYSNPTGADPIQEQPPNFNEPPPSYVPPPAVPAAVPDPVAQAQAFLEQFNASAGQIRAPSTEVPVDGAGDPRLKRRKMNHKSSSDVDDEIFGAANVGGVDEDGISAMLTGQ
jgi:regulator of Ty1 transposition protein 103